MKHICIGITAHVDAGKTTLSEAMLYQAGALKKLGRVDHQDAFLDTFALERARGITIFSKQAEFSLPHTEVTLLDTPGHVDFSAEMERTLQVLDCAVLVISGTDGVQAHTETLWRLLTRQGIPTFLFINKMDLDGADRNALLQELKSRLDSGCVDFTSTDTMAEELAVCDEGLLEQYLETGMVDDSQIAQLVAERKAFPCYFGSALRLDGVDALLDGLERYLPAPQYGADFGARVFKIARDAQGNRLSYLKITGGALSVREQLSGGEDGGWQEKVSGIRIYSGEKFRTAERVESGMVCAVTGLTHTRPGMGLGAEVGALPPVLEPVLGYRVCLPEGCDAHVMLRNLRQLEEEDPQLRVVWNERLGEIHLQLMGEVQLEILTSVIAERFGVDVTFDEGSIVYRETITEPVIGIGHFEPLRHYAEVHLLLEPAERGSGIQLSTACPTDVLDLNWQRLILTHLAEKPHLGVLTGAPITDVKITILAGRAHVKHTEGGDFREATYRAVRNGLMRTESLLLEPYYVFRLELPDECVGRAMTDIQRMNGTFEPPEQGAHGSILTPRDAVGCRARRTATRLATTRRKSSRQLPTTRPPMWRIRRIPCSARTVQAMLSSGMRCRSTRILILQTCLNLGKKSRNKSARCVPPAQAVETASAATRNCGPCLNAPTVRSKTAALKPSSRAVKRPRRLSSCTSPAFVRTIICSWTATTSSSRGTSCATLPPVMSTQPVKRSSTC